MFDKQLFNPLKSKTLLIYDSRTQYDINKGLMINEWSMTGSSILEFIYVLLHRVVNCPLNALDNSFFLIKKPWSHHNYQKESFCVRNKKKI